MKISPYPHLKAKILLMTLSLKRDSLKLNKKAQNLCLITIRFLELTM